MGNRQQALGNGDNGDNGNDNGATFSRDAQRSAVPFEPRPAWAGEAWAEPLRSRVRVAAAPARRV